jgi:cell wall-associated NlpC family hydrolase
MRYVTRAGTVTAVLVVGMSILPTAAQTAAVSAGKAGDTRWIDVSVATLWTEPGIDRGVDAAASGNPAKPGRWLRKMSLADRKWLYGHLETQALYGDRVILLGSAGAWSKIAVVDQPTPRNRAGYPGWVPTAQLTDQPPAVTDRVATVKRRSARTFADPTREQAAMRLSYGTRLPVRAVSGRAVEMVDLDGGALHVLRKAVRVSASGADPRRTRGWALVKQASKFLGKQYLWGGTSGFGYDCSGFTHEVYGHFGVTIPRDAGPQSEAGRPVARERLRKGDLVFFANSTGVHHVGMYVGRNRMIHSPRTGQPVQITSLSVQPWAGEYAGARRYRG